MGFKAEDVNQAYHEGVRHEQKRILKLMYDHIVKHQPGNGDAMNEYNFWRHKIERKAD